MYRSGRPVTALAVSLVYLLALFGSYCQMAPAVASATRGWDLGSGYRYKLTNTLLFSESDRPLASGDVGFRLSGEIDVTAVWRDPQRPSLLLLKLQLLSPQLWIKSRKAPEPEGFVEHTSKIGELTDLPILMSWEKGRVNELFLHHEESVTSLNLKRGLASLFQYETLDGSNSERDASGVCDVTYVSVGPQTIEKRKTNCDRSENFPPATVHRNLVFGVKLDSRRNATYDLTHSLLPSHVVDEERHVMTLTARPEAGNVVTSSRTLELVPGSLSASVVQASTLQEAVALLQPGYRKTSIILQEEPVTCETPSCSTLEKAIEENREALENSALGTAKSASAFLKLMPLVKNAGVEELAKLLKSPRYRPLRYQLLDIYGAASTSAAHQAATKILRQDETGDETERYLWALSLSPTPNPDVAKDILKKSEETMQNDKVSETYALTAAAMARHHGSHVLIEKARDSLILGLESCSGDECRLKFLRALRNLRSKASIPILLQYANNGNRAISVAAWKALNALPREHVTTEVKNAAWRTFYQVGSSKRDSSARTLALDIVLETNPSDQELLGLVKYLASSDPAFEIRKYVAQRLEQLSVKCESFAKNVTRAFKAADRVVSNYNVLAQKGLSTAFTRSFMNTVGSRGSLVTVQEVNSGLLKRGIVDVVLESENNEQALFSLGLFAGGLGSFVSSNGEETDTSEDESATAGMEIDLLGVGVRPFVFFSGQGELMGHVWSGTASTRTPAFQALASLHNYVEHVPLGSGFVAEMEVRGATSFDLAGQIQLSLWSRNAQSLVEMGSGVAIQGDTRIRNGFVQSKSEFLLTVEPKLELATDVDFSGPVSLCMRLTQPETTVRYQIFKVERITGSRHRLRKTRRARLLSPARSYLLNRKNNEMCSKVFS